MPRKKPWLRTKSRNSIRSATNKSQLIRDYKAKHPEAKPGEIVKALKAHRVSYGLVGNVLHRAKGGKKGKRGRKATGLTLESLLGAKRLVEQLGGIEAAKAALNVLETLG